MPLPKRDKYIAATAYRIGGSKTNDKLAAVIPEDDKAYYAEAFAAAEKLKGEKDEIALLLAATPWEYFGCNDNYDALLSMPNFGVSVKGTLPVTGDIFKNTAIPTRNHKYMDKKNDAIGDIIWAKYNEKYKRLEVLVLYKWEKASSECLRLRRNACLIVSMGYRVYSPDLPETTGEYCPYCGHFNRLKGDRCEHLANNLGMIIDGVPIYMINGEGIFIDISSIVIPGDSAARTIYRFAPSEPVSE